MMQFSQDEKNTINKAIQILQSKVLSSKHVTSPDIAIELLRLQLASKDHEVFAVMFLTTSHQVIELNEMFAGTIDSASVYPREVAKRALEVNASAAVLSHNHPSGNATPSPSDIALTKTLRECLNLFDIQVLDHIIVTKSGHYSFAENGLL